MPETIGERLLRETGLAGVAGVTVTSRPNSNHIDVMMNAKVSPSVMCFIIEKAVEIDKDKEDHCVKLLEFGIVINRICLKTSDMHRTESKELVLKYSHARKPNTLRLTFDVTYAR